MKTRMQRLIELADRLDSNIMGNLEHWKAHSGQSVVNQIKDDLAMTMACYNEADPTFQEHYLAGKNYSQAHVMYAITGDDDWLPDQRVEPLLDWR